MKKIIFSLVAMMIATVSFAQNPVATLTHDYTTTCFYSSNALQKAMEAAVDGDLISLSGGGFQSTDITKAVTVRGTGINEIIPTYIIGDFDINISDGSENRLYIEGCRIIDTITVKNNLRNAQFVKNDIARVDVAEDGVSNLINAKFLHCDVRRMHLRGNSGVDFVNSFVASFENNSETTATASFLNCMVTTWNTHYNAARGDLLKNSCFMNCVFYSGDWQQYPLPPSTKAFFCVATDDNNNYSYLAFSNAAIEQNCHHESTYIFVAREYSNGLTDDAKAKYLGYDNTQVGLGGGSTPYDSTPTYPRITKMNVAPKTTPEGKLNAEIDVVSGN